MHQICFIFFPYISFLLQVPAHFNARYLIFKVLIIHMQLFLLFQLLNLIGALQQVLFLTYCNVCRTCNFLYYKLLHYVWFSLSCALIIGNSYYYFFGIFGIFKHYMRFTHAQNSNALEITTWLWLISHSISQKWAQLINSISACFLCFSFKSFEIKRVCFFLFDLIRPERNEAILFYYYCHRWGINKFTSEKLYVRAGIV